MVRIGMGTRDLGALCFATRAAKRVHSRPRMVDIPTLIKGRPAQIRRVIHAISDICGEAGNRTATALATTDCFISFVDWADSVGMPDCLSGGAATRDAFASWASEISERYRRQDFEAQRHNRLFRCVRDILVAITGLTDLKPQRSFVVAKARTQLGTDPLAEADFAHVIAICNALFVGLTDLVLEHRQFPYKLDLPASLGWTTNYLWVFPAAVWRLPPRDLDRKEKYRSNAHWGYDYANGALATPESIADRYSGRNPPARRLRIAGRAVATAHARLLAANTDDRHATRIMLAMIAHNAFLFLFFCYTGANEASARQIETTGHVDAQTSNQRFRSIKFRANGKQVTLTCPAAFMPHLRRFMELREFLLNGVSYPYLFFSLGPNRQAKPRQIRTSPLYSIENSVLRTIDPELPRLGPRRLRASVADWYQRNHDAVITANVLQNTERTVGKRYNAGSAVDHRDEISAFLIAVAAAAKEQRVEAQQPCASEVVRFALEEGGHCEGFGHPNALVKSVPIVPTCRDTQGCVFCKHRVLIAGEEDARKIASAIYVMEQLILGPKHEEYLRPLIVKCQMDLEKIAAVGKCDQMITRVKQDIENGNLTPYFADKFQLFLELGVIG